MALTGREMRPCWPRKVAVCTKQFPISAPSVSYHLAILKESQLISAVHSKGFIYYDFNLDEMDEVIEWLYKISERSGENER